MINNVAFVPDIITLDCSQQTSLDNNDYIEIDESITNFEQLTQQQNFNLIRDQYKQSIQKLYNLYYHFSGLECQDSVDYTINTIYSTEKTLYSDLFYSYKQVRKYIIAITNYLDSCKENREENNNIAIICIKLSDCFGFCLSGFNSKIIDINDYISIYKNIELRSKINVKIKKLLEETIREILIKSSDKTKIPSSNVHYQNAFFNLVADDLNLATTIDRDANLNGITPKIIEDTIHQIKNKLPKIIICKYITNYLDSVFKDCLLFIGKDTWQNNTISNLNMGDISYLENNFITPINNYLCIKNEKEALKISNIFIEKEIGCYALADIKDILHYLLAKHINNIVKLSPNTNNVIINIDANINIYNIYDCYFYVLANQDREVLTLKHLLKLNIKSMQFNLYLPMFIQALENSKEEDICVFFNTISHNKKVIVNKYIEYTCRVINSCIRENSTKQKIITAIAMPYIRKQKKIDFVLYKLIIDNILADEIIEKFLEYAADIAPLLKLFNENNMRDFINGLNNKSILKIISNYNHVNVVKRAIQDIINKCLKQAKNLALLEKIDSKLIDDCLMALDYTTQKKLLENIINDGNKYRLAKCLINYFIMFDIRDNAKNSILHKIVLHNDKKNLQEIIKNLDSDTMHELQFAKNDKQQIPLVYAIELQGDRKDVITILLNNNKNIVSEPNKFGNTAFICTAVFNKPEYAEIILKHCDNNIINKINNVNYNALMEASSKGYYDSVNFLLKNLKSNENFLLTKDEHGNNSLMLAIINGHESCAMLHIENCNSKILLCRNKNKNNALMLASNVNMIKVVEKILTTYSHNDILKASKKSEYNSFMISIKRHNSQITKLFLG